jgi:hypothetical protein
MRSPPLDLITQLAVRKAVNLYFNAHTHTLVSLRHTPGNERDFPFGKDEISLWFAFFISRSVANEQRGAMYFVWCVNECIIFAHTHARAPIFSGFHLISSRLPRRRTPHTHVHFQCFNPIVCLWLVSAQLGRRKCSEKTNRVTLRPRCLGMKWEVAFSHTCTRFSVCCV